MRGIRVAWGIFSLRDFEVKEISVVAIGTDTATVRWTIAGSRSPFSGEPWATTGVSVLEISGAEITAETVYYDASGL